MKKFMTKLLLFVGILCAFSLLNLLIVFTLCKFRGYTTNLAYSDGLFYTGLVYMILATYLMMTNGTSFQNMTNFKVGTRALLFGRTANNFQLNSEKFAADARSSIQNSFSAFAFSAALFVVGMITSFGLAALAYKIT